MSWPAPADPATAPGEAGGDVSFPAAGSVFGAPVPEDGFAAPAAPGPPPAAAAPAPAPPSDRPDPAPAGPAPYETPRPEPVRVAAAAETADSSSYRPAHAEGAAKTFDVATSRRRPVVFEEDDDLDIPDFLK